MHNTYILHITLYRFSIYITLVRSPCRSLLIYNLHSHLWCKAISMDDNGQCNNHSHIETKALYNLRSEIYSTKSIYDASCVGVDQLHPVPLWLLTLNKGDLNMARISSVRTTDIKKRLSKIEIYMAKYGYDKQILTNSIHFYKIILASISERWVLKILNKVLFSIRSSQDKYDINQW